jgi:Ca2+-binding RTX toxin-like protein
MCEICQGPTCALIDENGDTVVADEATDYVFDFTGILYTEEGSNNARWNGFADLGTPVIVTYSFLEGDDVPTTGETAYTTTSTSTFTAAQRANMEDVFAEFSSMSGVVFVEVDSGAGMIDLHNVDGSSYGGWANVSNSSETYTSNGIFVVDNSGDYDEGSYGYLTMLHELGHAMGLQHPFEGMIQLDPSVDDEEHTVMTYNATWPYVDNLGTFDVQALQHLYGDAIDISDWTFTYTSALLTVEGSTGADTIVGVSGSNRLYGKKGRDDLFGRDDDDAIYGGKGNDTISGLYGDDKLKGGDGNDTIYGSMDGSAGYSDADRLYGGNGQDTLYGQGGSDKLYGNKGTDTLYGGTGSDIIKGGNGSDTLYGGQGSDKLSGGNGTDTFVFLSDDDGNWNTITDYDAADDTIDLTDTGYDASDMVLYSQNGGADTLIQFDSSLTIILEGNAFGTVDASDFIF